MNKLRNQINERGVTLDDYPDTYLTKAKKDVDKNKTYSVAFKEIIDMLKAMSWKDITFIDGPGTSERTQFPLLPEDIRMKVRDLARIDPNKAKANFSIGSYTFAKLFDNSAPSASSTIYMKVESESSGQRSHFPNEGIPTSLRGTNLGYKLYRALLEKFKYLRSNTGGTTAKNYAWQSLVSSKKDAQGRPTEDDVHAIVGAGAVFAMIKTIPEADKIKHVKHFLNDTGEINKGAITKRNFVIDDELKAILPDSLLAEVDPERREEAERLRREREKKEREKREREALRTHSDRFELYAPFGVDAHDWEVGDYIVIKEYLMQVNFTDLPVRKVVEKNGNEYTAIKISDIAEYEASGELPSRDPRKTRNKTDWVKTRLKRGQWRYMEDPSAGRLVVKGSPGGRSTGTPTPATQNPNAGNQMTDTQKRLIKNFMRQEFYVTVKSADWDNRRVIASSRQPIIPFIVRKTGTGRSAIYKVMNARTAEVQDNLTKAQYDALNLKKFDMTQLERKSSVVAGDWVYVKDHRSAIGFVCVVKNVTPAANRQPGLYIWTGDQRPQYISQPQTLWKLTEAANESTSIVDFLNFDKI